MTTGIPQVREHCITTCTLYFNNLHVWHVPENTPANTINVESTQAEGYLYSTNQKKLNREYEREQIQNGYKNGNGTGTERIQNGKGTDAVR